MSNLIEKLETLATKWDEDESEDSSQPLGHAAATELRALIASAQGEHPTDCALREGDEPTIRELLEMTFVVMRACKNCKHTKLVTLIGKRLAALARKEGEG